MAAVAVASLGLLACLGDDKPSPEDLEAILRDGELTMVSRHGLTAAGGAPVPTGDAGFPGAGGGNGALDAGVPPRRDGGPVDGAIGFDGGATGGSTFDGGVGSGGRTGTDGPTGSGGRVGTDGPVGSGGRGGFGGGFPMPGVQFPQSGQGLWQFDDCNPGRTELRDSSFSNHVAFRSVSVACAEGLQGNAVTIDEVGDYVYVPDQPNFTFDSGVTAAAWVRPTRLGGVRTIFRKREGGTSSFVLLSNGRDYQFVIRLEGGGAASVSARAALNAWSHVAGTYDGNELRLYINGAVAASMAVSGRLSSGVGPLLMGNDAFGRKTDGNLDNVFFDTVAATPEQVAQLTCVSAPGTLVAVPSAGPPVPAGTAVQYDVQIKNNDSPTCTAKDFQFQAFSNNGGLFITPNFQSVPPIAPGETAHIPLSVTSDPTLEPDDYVVSLTAFGFRRQFELLSGSVTYSVVGGPCSVRTRRELMITDLSVVEDPVRTGPGGAWTFGRLMTDLASSPAAAPAMVEKVLSSWLEDQTVNGQVIPARPAMQDLVLTSFPRQLNGELDLERAPMRLLAIVNRLDLRDIARGNAGEGRFVFGVLDGNGFPTEFTMIFEYKIPATTETEVIDLAKAWHALGGMTFPSPAYNAALQALTDRFATRGAAPSGINGSSLAQFRTNEIALSAVWQLREFHLSRATGGLEPAPVALTPNQAFDGSPLLAQYINENETAIIAEKHTVPETFGGQPFLTGSVLNFLTGWQGVGVNNPEARQKFSFNTCNGCHSSQETNTSFLQVNPRARGQESFLSPFMTGTLVFDQQAGLFRSFNDLGRRNRDLQLLLCPDQPLPPSPMPPTPPMPPPVGGRSGTAGRGGGSGGFVGTGGFDGGMGTGGSGPGGASGGMGGIGGSGGPVVGRPAATGGPLPATALRVIDESTVELRPDFVAKGINRAD